MSFEIKNSILVKYTEKNGITEITIPDSVEYIGKNSFEKCKTLKSVTLSDGVVSISNCAFSECESLESIAIPDKVRYIGDMAFYNCKSLKGITIPNGVKNIGYSTFYNCQNLKDITIPDGVTTINNNAFDCCIKLESVTIPNSVTHIKRKAFADCRSLTSILIPDSVTDISDSAFDYCESLENIDVSKKNEKFCSLDGVLYDKNMTRLIKYPEAKKSNGFTFPDSVTNIGNSAFSYCANLKNIAIPDSVTSIGNSAFYDCANLKSIAVPDSIKNIEIHAFSEDVIIIIFKDDVKVPFILKGSWNYRKPEELLNYFLMTDINNRWIYFSELESHYQLPLALFMVFAYPQVSAYYLNYLKDYTEDAVRYLIDYEKVDLIYRIIESGFVTWTNIDALISYAVEHTQNGGSSEPQLVLAKYKSDKFGENGIDEFDKFML